MKLPKPPSVNHSNPLAAGKFPTLALKLKAWKVRNPPIAFETQSPPKKGNP